MGKKRMRFLKATGGSGWKTLEALVRDLDRAGYWKGEPERGPVEKRRHVRKMISTLVLRVSAPTNADGSPPFGGRHLFVSAVKAGDSGELVRVYKQFLSLTPEEQRDVLEDEEANRAYREQRSALSGMLAKAYAEGDEEANPLFVLEELTEETMRRAWPGAELAGRRRVVLAALIRHRRSEEALQAASEWCRAQGFDIHEMLDEYLRAAEVSPVVDPKEASEVARSATEYFKVVDELEGLNFKEAFLRTLSEAHARTVVEFAEREGIDREEAAALLAGWLGEYADEFQGVLETYRRDRFGWTLDEHLQFAVERRVE